MSLNTPTVTENNTSGQTSTSLTTHAVGSIVFVFFALQATGATLSALPSSTHVTWQGSVTVTQNSDATVARTVIGAYGVVTSVATATVSYNSATTIRDSAWIEYSDTTWSSPTWTIIGSGGNFSDSVAGNTNFNDVSSAITTGSTGDQGAIGYIRSSQTVNANSPSPFTNVQLTNPPGSGYVHGENLATSTALTPTSQISATGTFCAAVIFFQATAPSAAAFIAPAPTVGGQGTVPSAANTGVVGSSIATQAIRRSSFY